MKIIGYGRVSTEEQQTNYSLDAQSSRFEQVRLQNSWQSLGFRPEAESGTTIANRPVLCAILDEIRRGTVDALWVREIDRLCRPEDLADITVIEDALSQSGTKLIVDTQEYDLSQDSSVLMFDFNGIMAKHFRRQLLRNMNRGKVRKAQIGRKAGGQDIYGYRTDDDGTYHIHQEEAEVVRLIYELALSGRTMRQIQSDLGARGILSPRRRRWSVSVIGGILHNDVYLGVYRFQKTKHGKDTDGSRYKVHRQAEQIVVGTPKRPNHPPIIDQETFLAVQEQLIAKRKQSTERLHLATGILRCATCNSICHVKYSSAGTKNSAPKYACSNKPHCQSRRLDLQEVNEKLWDELLSLILKPERLEQLVKAPTVVTSTHREVNRLEAQANAIERKLERLLSLYEDGDIDKITYVRRRDQHQEQLHKITAAIESTKPPLEQKDQHDATAALQQVLRILGRSHSRFTTDQKTRVFRSMVKQASLGDDSLLLELYTEPIENNWYKYRQAPEEQRRVRNLKVARTIADLEGAEDLAPKHLSEAVQYRTLDRNLWL